MKIIRWKRFSWDLTRLAAESLANGSPYPIREATPEDEEGVRKLVMSAFTLDSDWNYILSDIRGRLEESLDRVFNSKQTASTRALVLTHGTRIVGVSALNPEPDADNHLLTGPCIPIEYRNRGLATALLAQSLLALQNAGLTMAHGITLENGPTAESVYPKFDSTQAPYLWNARPGQMSAA